MYLQKITMWEDTHPSMYKYVYTCTPRIAIPDLISHYPSAHTSAPVDPTLQGTALASAPSLLPGCAGRDSVRWAGSWRAGCILLRRSTCKHAKYRYGPRFEVHTCVITCHIPSALCYSITTYRYFCWSCSHIHIHIHIPSTLWIPIKATARWTQAF